MLRCATVCLAAGAMLIAACTPPPPPADGPGVVPRESRAGVRLHYDPFVPGQPDARPVLEVRLDDARGRRTTESTAWQPAARSLYSPYLETATADSLRIAAVLRSPGGDTLGTAAFALPLAPDRAWGVRFDVYPLSQVRGQPGIDADRYPLLFPLRGQEGAADPLALFVRVGENSISRPEVH